MKRLEARRLHAKCMLAELGRVKSGFESYAQNAALTFDRYERCLPQIRHAADWIIEVAPVSENLSTLRLEFARGVLEFSRFRLSIRIDSPRPDFPTSKKRRLRAAQLLLSSEVRSELALYAEYLLLAAGEVTRSAYELAGEASMPMEDHVPSRMALGSHLILLSTLNSDVRRLILRRLLEALSHDIETSLAPLSVSVEVARAILGVYRDRAFKLPWVPDQVSHVLALAAPHDPNIANELAVALSNAAYRLDPAITAKALTVAETNASVAEILAGGRWRTLSSEQKRALVVMMVTYASESASVANILGKRRWLAVPQEMRSKVLQAIFDHAAKDPKSVNVLVRHLWDFLDDTQRQGALIQLLVHATLSPDALAIAAKDRWSELSPSQRRETLEILLRVAPTSEIIAIVALKERWIELGEHRQPILKYLIERSSDSGQAAVVLLQDLWAKLTSDERTRTMANGCRQAERDPQVAVVACKLILTEVSDEQRQQLLSALLLHSQRDVMAATAFVQGFWSYFDRNARELVTTFLLDMSMTNSAAAVAAATYLTGTPEMDNVKSAKLVASLFEFSAKDWRAAVVLAESFGAELTGKKRTKIATLLFLLSRRNRKCAEAASLLEDSLTEDQRHRLKQNLDEELSGYGTENEQP